MNHHIYTEHFYHLLNLMIVIYVATSFHTLNLLNSYNLMKQFLCIFFSSFALIFLQICIVLSFITSCVHSSRRTAPNVRRKFWLIHAYSTTYFCTVKISWHFHGAYLLYYSRSVLGFLAVTRDLYTPVNTGAQNTRDRSGDLDIKLTNYREPRMFEQQQQQQLVVAKVSSINTDLVTFETVKNHGLLLAK